MGEEDKKTTTMGEEKSSTTPAPPSKDSMATETNEEARLRERLKAKKTNEDEARLRERLKAKQRERRRSNSDGGGKEGEEEDEEEKKNGDLKKKRPHQSKENGSKKPPEHSSNKGGGPSNGNKNNRVARSRSRDNSRHRSNSRDRRSSSSQRGPGGPRGGRRGRGGRGPPPPVGWGGGGRGGPYPVDPYGRIPPGVPPPPNGPPMPFRGGGGYGAGPPHGFGYGPPPPGHGGRRGPPPPDFYDQDQYGRAPRPRSYRPRSRSISRSRSYSSRSASSASSRSPPPSRSRRSPPSRSMSPESEDDRSKRSLSDDDEHHDDDRSRERRHKRHRRGRSSRARRSRSPSSSGSSVSGSSSSSSSSSSDEESEIDKDNSKTTPGQQDDTFTKDQRTVFVNQLVMRTTSKDIRRYFRRKVGAKVNEVILLKDRRTGKHKGCAYIEMKTMEDVGKALNVSGQPPDFQRFPILVKPSEAEKNYLVPASSATMTAVGGTSTAGPLVGPNGQLIESQKVYVGSLDPSITQEHLLKLFSQFGDLTKVSLQMDPSSGISKGYAFLSFRDPKDANLAIQTMSNQVLAGRCMKTGWATQQTGTAGVQIVTTEEFPADASARAQKAHIVLSQMSIGAGLTMPSSIPDPSIAPGQPSSLAATGGPSKIPTVAEARQNLAASAASSMMAPAVAAPGQFPMAVATGAQTAASVAAALSSPDAKIIGGSDNPTKNLLVHNMYDKDEETEPGWANEIKEEFQEECSKFGKIDKVTVMSKEPGGKIYASFDTIEAAKTCASSLAGRWFDKRQLRVEFVSEEQLPKDEASS